MRRVRTSGSRTRSASVRDERRAPAGRPARRDRGVRAVRGLHRMRTVPVRVPGRPRRPTRTSGRPRWRPRSACSRSRAARITDRVLDWAGRLRTGPGDATPRSSAPRPVRPTSAPPSGSWRCAARSPADAEPWQRWHRDERSGAPGHRATRSTTARSCARASGSPASGWFDPRGRALGGFAFAVNRVTGLGLVFYLYLHLGVLSMLLRGESRVERLPSARDQLAVPAPSTSC